MRVRERILAKFWRASRAEFNSRARSLYGIGAGKSGLPGGTVASFNRFLGVPFFGAKIGGCTPFRRSPL